MTKTKAKTQTERFTALVSGGKTVTAATAARRLNTTVDNVYNIVYRLRAQGVVVERTETGAYTL